MAVDKSAKRAFPGASKTQWREDVGKTLRGQTDDGVSWTTSDGVEIDSLHVRGDIDALPHLTSGAVGILHHPRARAIRQRVETPRPEAARGVIEQALRGGADDLLIRLDRLARAGLDPMTISPGWEEFNIFEHDAGADGCAIYHSKALATVLESVDLTKTRVAFDAGASSLPVLCMLFVIAEDRGVPFNQLRVELGLDPVHELTCGAPLGTTHSQLLDEISIAVGNTMGFEDFVPLTVHSTGIHEAGASPSVELGYSIATGIEYVRHLLSGESGLEIGADEACASLGFHLQVDTELCVEIAKIRATRLLWTKVARSFGASDLQTRIHAESSLRAEAHEDVHTNLLRTSLHGIAATLADCDSITLAPFDGQGCQQSGLADSLARNQQHLLREEAHLHRVQDPCGGSYSVEMLTHVIAQEAWDFVTEIEATGGVIKALRAGVVQCKVRECAEQRQREVQQRQRVLVGINRFVDTSVSHPGDTEPDAATITANLHEYIERRDEDAIEAAMQQETIDSIKAARAGCTVGEMMTILRGEFDLSLEVPFLEPSPDGAPFEQLRAMVRSSGLRVLPLLTGGEKIGHARMDFARDYLVAGGFEVLPCLDTLNAQAIEELAPDFAVLCGDDSEYPEWVAGLPTDLNILVAGRPLESLGDRVAAFLHHGDNSYLTLRRLFLSVCDGDGPDDAASGGTP